MRFVIITNFNRVRKFLIFMCIFYYIKYSNVSYIIHSPLHPQANYILYPYYRKSVKVKLENYKRKIISKLKI